jgi:hypothetical protein
MLIDNISEPVQENDGDRDNNDDVATNGSFAPSLVGSNLSFPVVEHIISSNSAP